MMETLKATGGEQEFSDAGEATRPKQSESNKIWSSTGNVLTAIPPFTKAIISSAILGFGGFRVMDGDMTVGLLVAFQSSMDGFTKPITTFVTFGNALQETRADLLGVDDVLRYEPDPLTSPGRILRPKSFERVIKLSGPRWSCEM